MSKMFYLISFGVCFLVFCFLEGCSSDVIMERGAEKAKFEQDYKPIIVKVQELENVKDDQVWCKKDISISIPLVRKASSYGEFHKVVSTEDAFVVWDVNFLKSSLGCRLLEVVFYKNKAGVYHLYRQTKLIDMSFRNSRFLEIGYVGSGQFAIKHEYRPLPSFKLLFIRIFKLILILGSGCLLSVLFIDLGWVNTNKSSKPSS